MTYVGIGLRRSGKFSDDVLLVHIFVFALQVLSSPAPMSFLLVGTASEVMLPGASPSLQKGGRGGGSRDALVLLSPSLPLSLKCCCSNSSLCGECCFPISACSQWERSYSRVAAVASASGAGVRLCPSALDGESAPLVLLRRLHLASAPPCCFRARFARPAVAIGRAYRSI